MRLLMLTLLVCVCGSHEHTCVAGSGSASRVIRSGMTLIDASMPLICLLPMHTSPMQPHAWPRTNDSADGPSLVSLIFALECCSGTFAISDPFESADSSTAESTLIHSYPATAIAA